MHEIMTTQALGAAAFFIVDSGSRATAGFPLKIAGKPPGGPGGDAPWHVFAFFLRAKKEGGPQAKKTGMAICPLTRCDYILNALMP